MSTLTQNRNNKKNAIKCQRSHKTVIIKRGYKMSTLTQNCNNKKRYKMSTLTRNRNNKKTL